MKQTGVDFTLINTKKYVGLLQGVINPFLVLLQVLLKVWKADVLFLNSSRGGTKHLGPLLYFLARLLNKKFVFRPFGGDIKEYTAAYSNWRKGLFKRTILKADLFFLQTKALMDFYTGQARNTCQLPTSREQPPKHLISKNKAFSKRFIYLGFVNEAKGIDQLLAAAQQLGEETTVHIYGPLKSAKYESLFKDDQQHYQGVLKKEEVLEKLASYDILVLPTFYEGEGYPGAIIEAYSLGLPVITTHWKAIPEIVEDGKTGILVPPKSTPDLVEAMEYFTATNYPAHSKYAQNYFQANFSSTAVCGKAIEQINALFNTSNSTIKT